MQLQKYQLPLNLGFAIAIANATAKILAAANIYAKYLAAAEILAAANVLGTAKILAFSIQLVSSANRGELAVASQQANFELWVALALAR